MSGEHADHFNDNRMRTSYMGMRGVWGGAEPFGIKRADRRQHLYCVGKSGTGKSTLLRNLILQDIYNGEGVGVIDPHGDLADDLLNCIPPWRTDHVVYFHPADLDYPIGLNLLEQVPHERRHRIASGLVGALKSIWRDSWGPRLEYILYASIAALLDCENVSLLGIQRMLVDQRYRRWVVRQTKDPMVRSFWQHEFESYDHRFRSEVIAPVQNKVGQVLMSPPIRNILGQVRSKLDMAFTMNNRRIFIANLSKGLLGEDKANLLGSLLVASFELAALQRAAVPEASRQDFFLYIDEFRNFATDSFATILSEARKYRLSLTLSHQYLDQVHDRIHRAVFGNVGSIVSFRVGERDARVLAEEFGHRYRSDEFTSLSNFEVLVKLLANGRQIEPFAGFTIGSLDLESGRRKEVVRRSRERYASPRMAVEDKIRRWFGTP